MEDTEYVKRDSAVTARSSGGGKRERWAEGDRSPVGESKGTRAWGGSNRLPRSWEAQSSRASSESMSDCVFSYFPAVSLPPSHLPSTTVVRLAPSEGYPTRPRRDGRWSGRAVHPADYVCVGLASACMTRRAARNAESAVGVATSTLCAKATLCDFGGLPISILRDINLTLKRAVSGASKLSLWQFTAVSNPARQFSNAHRPASTSAWSRSKLLRYTKTSHASKKRGLMR